MLAQQAALVGDINLATPGSNPRLFASFGGCLYFVNEEPNRPAQLWRANPASGGVELVEATAGVPYEVQELLVVSDRLYARAYDPSFGWSLYQIGAAPGSTLSRVEGTAGMDPQGLTALGGQLFYNAYATDTSGNGLGRELLRLDPQTGLIQSFDLNPGGNWGYPRSLTALNGRLFFLADGAGSGSELWSFNPATDATPQLLRDIWPGAQGSAIDNLTVSGGKLYFTASDGSSDEELWTSDGTPGGTQRVVDINRNTYGSDPQPVVSSGGKLFFSAYTDASGWELHRLDPTSGSVQKLEINPGSGSASPGGNSGGFADLNGTLYFSAVDDATGWQLWRVRPDGALQRLPLGPWQSGPQELTVVDGNLYFSANGSRQRGIDLSRNFALSGEAATLSFDFLRLDSWDGESLHLYIDNQLVFSAPFYYYYNSPNRSGEGGGVSWSITAISEVADLAFSGWSDQIFRIQLSIPAGRDNIRLGLGSSLNQGVEDESYGIRNLEIRSAADPSQVLLSDPGADPTPWSGGSSSSSPGLGSFIGRYSSEASPYLGRELWRIDNASGEPVAIDINPGEGSSNPSTLFNVNGKLYFTAYGPGVGYELWTLDPADQVPHLVADVNPGESGSRNGWWWYGNSESAVVAAAGRLYYAADGPQGRELYMVSPGMAGAQLIDLNLGEGSGQPHGFTVVGDRLFFKANDGSSWGLYATDLDTGVPSRLAIPGLGTAGNVDSLLSVGDRLYFRNNSYNDTGSYGSLYTVEPSSGVVSAVSGMSYVYGLTSLHGKVFFRAYSSASNAGYELFALSPDDPSQTPKLLDLRPGGIGSAFNLLAADADALYAVAYGQPLEDLSRSFNLGGEAVSLSFEFLRLDSWDNENFSLYLNGQEVFSQPFYGWDNVTEPRSGSGAGFDWTITPISVLDQFGGNVYSDQLFRVAVSIPAGHASIRLGLGSSLDEAIDNESYGIRNLEIRSAADPSQLLLSDPGTDASLWTGGRTASGTALGTFLGAYGAANQWNLWRLDPVELNGTMRPLLPASAPNKESVGNLFSVGGTLYFSYDDGVHGRELWQSDGTAAGTRLAADINGRTLPASPRQLTDVNGKLYFIADDGINGRGLYGLDPSTGQVERLVVPGLSGLYKSYADGLVNANGRLYFSTSSYNDTGIYRPLYTLDPGTGAISQIADIHYVSSLKYLQGQLFFTANSSSYQEGYELYRIADDSTQAQLIDINPGGGSSSPDQLTLHNGSLYFAASRDGLGRELFRLDANFNAIPVRDIRPGAAGSDPRALFSVGSSLYFIADDGFHGTELWQTDGTEAGTQLARDINNLTLDANPDSLVDVNGILYFMATDGALGRGLYRIDPATGSPQRLTVPGLSGSNGSHADSLVNANGRLYFNVNFYNDYGTYRPLYSLDPATGEISQVEGVHYAAGLKHLGEQLFFAAYSSSFQEGYELYRIADGSTTPQLIDINPGSASSSPDGLVFNNGTVYFAATRNDIGRELFRLNSDFTPLPLANLSRYTSNPQQLTAVGDSVYFTGYGAAPGGPGQDASQSFTFDGTATTISFDLLRLDTWDGESFSAYIDDQPLFSQPFYHSQGTAATSGITDGISWSITPTSELTELNGPSYGLNGIDQSFRITLQLPGGRSTVKLGFSSGLDQASPDESYAIDNLEIRSADNSLIASDSFDSVGSWAGGVISSLTGTGSVLGPYAVRSENWRLWKVNPTTQRVEAVSIPSLVGDSAYSIDSFVALGNRVFFRYPGSDGSAYSPLYSIDPTTGEAGRVAGLRDVSSFQIAGNALYVIGNYADQYGLQQIDANANVTPMDLQGGFSPGWLTAVGNTLYFTAFAYGPNNEGLGNELWKIDPVSGSPRVIDLRPGGNSSYPRDLVAVQGTLYFIAQREENGAWIGEELYRIDPVTDQVELLGDIYSGTSSSKPVGLTLSNGQLYFTATDGSHGRELWRVQVNSGGSGIEVSRSLAEDTPLAFVADDFATPFATAGGGTLQAIRILSLPLNGLLRLNGVACTTNQTIPVANLGQLSFVPNADYNGTAAFNWSGSNGGEFASQPSLVNLTVTPVADAPRLQQPLLNRSIYSNRSDGYTFDLNTFSDPDIGQALTYSATLADGSPLPAWISLNGRSFNFNPPIGNASVDIRVVATDPDGLTSLASAPQGSPINWIDWTGADLALGGALGVFPEHQSVSATLSGGAPLSFVQTDGGTNYFNPAGPYTAPGASAPTTPDIIGLLQAGSRTITLSQAVSNLYLAYVSINGNTLTFDRDFEIVSQSDAVGGSGYWGSGIATKQQITINGATRYQLVAQGGEPHGLLRFSGPLASLSMSSAVDENWYGFTIGTGDPTLSLSAAGSVFNLQVLNAVPQWIGLSNGSINENSANGTVVGSFGVSDPNSNDRHTLTLLDSAEGRFALSGNPSTGYSLVVADGTRLDYEAATAHQIRVGATDESGLGREEWFTIQINNLPDSAAGNLSFSAANFSVREDGQPLVAVTVNRLGGVEGSVSATLLLSPGTATYPADYALEQLTVLFANGETSRTVTIPIANDALIEGDQTLTLTLTNPTGGAGLTGQLTATLTIVDNDFPAIPTPTVTAQLTNDSTPLISGTASVAPANQFRVSVNGRTYSLGSSPELVLNGSSWSLAIPAAHSLGDGLYNVLATVQDPNGTSVSDASSGELRIDTVAPLTTLSSGPSPLYFPLLQGRSEPGAALQISCGGASWALTVPADGDWQLDTGSTPASGSFAPNRDGANPLTISATDAAGNSSLFSGQLSIRYPYPDLRISGASLSGGAALGSVVLDYTVVNSLASGPLLPEHTAWGNWIDRFYLSPDAVYGNGNDLAIGPLVGMGFAPSLVAPSLGRGNAVSGPLASGDSYSGSLSVQLPEYPGSYYLIAVTDADRSLAEGLGEGNNVFISAAPITVAPIYSASVSTTVTSLNAGQSISLSGQLVQNASGAGVAGKSVTVVFINDSTGQRFERQVSSGADGGFSLSFSPSAEQAGAYRVAARYSQNPSEDLLAGGSLNAEDSFRVQGLVVSPGSTVIASIAEGATYNGSLQLRNSGADTLNLSGLSVSGAPAGWSINLASLPASLAAGASTNVSYSVTAPDASVLFDDFELIATAAASGQESLTARQPLAITILPNRPLLAVAAAQRSAAMLLGQRTLHEVTLTNNGNASTSALNVVLPGGAPWLSLYGSPTLAPLAPGASTSIRLALDPPANLPLAIYQASIGFLDEAHPADSLVVPFSFRATSSASGSVSVAVYDEFSSAPSYPTVSNVSVRLYDRISDSLLQTITDADGRFSFTDLPVGEYAIEVRADRHASSWQTFTVDPGDQEQLDVFLPSEFVRYSWVVVPTTVQDRYLITLEATFETEVPLPVVTITPSPVDLRSLDLLNQSVVVPLTITNHGLVAARDLSFQAPVDPNFSFTLLNPLSGQTIAAESSLLVDLRIERIAEWPNGCSSVELGTLYWDYGTFLPNQVAPITIEKSTPLPFLIDSDCHFTGLPPAPGGGFGGGGGGGGGFPSIPDLITVAPSPVPVPYVTARVKIRIEQEAVLSRDAFEGTFVLENLDPSIDLANIDIDLEIFDGDGNLVNDRFVISAPTLSGFAGDLNGNGSLAANSSGQAVYTILAKDTAAPIKATQYSIGGSVSYSRSDGSVDFNLAPAAITVLPQPVLAFDYFLQRDVFSDDPFTTPLKEASQPFVLGLLAHNRGYGVANDLTITSAEPEIIENELGLKIGFDLIGSAVNGNAVTPSLKIDLGDLANNSTSEAYWLMTSTLQGRFIDYKASFEYINPLGIKDVPGLSQLSEVNLHELTRRVRDHRPGADLRFDYLVNSNPPVVAEDNTGKDLIPDILYLSNDSTEPVTALAPDHASISLSTINDDGEASLSFAAASGWTYLRVLEPSFGNRPITAIRRADGSLIRSDNFWITDRTFPEHGRPTYESSLHILDYASAAATTTYTLMFGASTTNTAPTLGVGLADQTAQESLPFFFIVPSTSFLDTDAGDSLSYSASLASGEPLPGWLSFNAATRTFSGTPGASDVTTLQLQVTASDRAGLSVSDSFSLLVAPLNHAPVVTTPVPDQTINAGAAWSYTLPDASFRDPESGDLLTYSASLADGSSLPAWLGFDPASRTFSGTPSDADAATLSLKVSVTDPDGASISDSFSLTVIDITPPQINGITVVGNQLQLQFSEAIVTSGLSASRFSASVAGVNRSISSWAPVAGDPSRLNLTLSGSAPTSSQTLALRYSDLTAANDAAGVVQDVSGNDLLSITTPGRNVDTFTASSNVTLLAASYSNLLLTGAASSAVANSGNNRIRVNQATPVNNVLTGAGGSDDMDAGDGSDIYLITNSDDHSTAEISDSGSGATDSDELRFASTTSGQTLTVFAGDSGLERITIGTGNAAAVITATTALNVDASAAPNALTITGNAGDNSLIGSAYNDILTGGAGLDAMNGAGGSDLYLISSSLHHGAAEISDTGAGAGEIDELRFSSTTANQTLTVFAGDSGLERISIGTGSDAAAVITGTTTLNVDASAAANGLTISGNNGTNRLTGGAYNDSLIGNAGNDILNGGAGLDAMDAGDGSDIYLITNSDEHGAAEISDSGSGATDSDELRFASTSAGQTLTVFAGDSGLERITIGSGTATAAVITATTALNVDASAAANGLTITGNAGDNSLIGSAYNDILNGGAGLDAMDGAGGSDLYLISSSLHHGAAEISDTGAGAGEIDELRFSSTTSGQTLTVFAGDSGLERISIGTGSDAAAVITGTTTLHVDASAAANDLTISGNNGANRLSGGAYNDSLIGNGGNDLLTGGAGLDAMDGGDGSDIYLISSSDDHSAAEISDSGSGATDSDELRFASTSAGQTLTVFAGDSGLERITIGTGTAAAAVITATTALNVDASAAANGLTITGNAGDNSLIGSAYNDILNGGAGNDLLSGGAGDDAMDAGKGSDIYLISSSDEHGAAEISDSGSGATDSDELRFASTSAGQTLTVFAGDSGLERITIGTGTAAAAVITASTALHVDASAAPNALTITGNAGANTLIGSAYNDILNGGAGLDAMDAGDGSDIYLITNSDDHSTAEISDSGSGATDSDELRFASTSAGQTLTVFAGDSGLERITIGTGNAAAAVITATTALNINAAAAPNALTITGNAGDNSLIGSAYNDILNGGAGLDAMDGAGGSDLYLISSSLHHSAAEISDTGAGAGEIDELRFSSTTANQTLTVFAGDSGLERISIGTGSDAAAVITATTTLHVDASAAAHGLAISGNNGANRLKGSAYNDSLIGNDGNDILNGGGGNDSLSGGAGADIFRFDFSLNGLSNVDQITDFNVAESDVIQLENSIFTALPTTGTLAATAFYVGSAALTSAQRILFNPLSNTLLYDPDGSNPLAPTAFATVTPGLTLSNLQFVVT